MKKQKNRRKDATKLEVIEEPKKAYESTLNIDYLNEVNEEGSTEVAPIEFMGVKFIDKRKIENEAIKKINALSIEEKENIGNHLRPIIRSLINEEYKNLLMERNAIKVNIDTDDLDEYSGNKNELSDNNIFNNEADFLKALKKIDKANLSLAYIYASNRSLVEKRYGSQASKNITDTILLKLRAIFTKTPVFAGIDEYIVCNDLGNESFTKDLNSFREAIFSVNTSNEFKFPIELNIFDVEGKNYGSIEETIKAAKNGCFDEDDDYFEEPLDESEEKSPEETKPALTYKVEYMDEYAFDEDESLVEAKELEDFPTYIINAIITDKVINSTTKARLVINLIDKSQTKQEIVVSGSIGQREILLVSDFNDDKTTILLDEEMGFILRFGSAIKTFILKDKKDRYDLWQDISKNALDKTPLLISGMYVCPISKNESKAAFIYTKDNARTLIKTDDSGHVSLDGKEYFCQNDGSTFTVKVR